MLMVGAENEKAVMLFFCGSFQSVRFFRISLFPIPIPWPWPGPGLAWHGSSLTHLSHLNAASQPKICVKEYQMNPRSNGSWISNSLSMITIYTPYRVGTNPPSQQFSWESSIDWVYSSMKELFKGIFISLGTYFTVSCLSYEVNKWKWLIDKRKDKRKDPRGHAVAAGHGIYMHPFFYTTLTTTTTFGKFNKLG